MAELKRVFSAFLQKEDVNYSIIQATSGEEGKLSADNSAFFFNFIIRAKLFGKRVKL